MKFSWRSKHTRLYPYVKTLKHKRHKLLEIKVLTKVPLGTLSELSLSKRVHWMKKVLN